MIEILKQLGFNLAYIVAGFSGGVVTLLFVNLERNKAVLTIFACALTANYLTAWIQHYLQLPAGAELGSAFVVGIIGISLVRGIYKRGENWEHKPLSDDLSRRAP